LIFPDKTSAGGDALSIISAISSQPELGQV
jgi:hypothetical protein